MSILRKIASAFQDKPEMDGEQLDRLIDGALHGVRTTDPETRPQLLRLRRTLAEKNAQASGKITRLVPRLAFGTAAAIALSLSAYLFLSYDGTSVRSYATERGEMREVTLEDGTRIQLNYASTLVVPGPLSDGTRRVTLTGEAFFTVTHNDTPFLVTTSSGTVEVVGTEFNLRARNGALEVAVINGTVDLGATRDGRDSTVRVVRSQRAICTETGFPVRIGDIPTEAYPGWLHGRIYLSGTTFADARQEIENRFDVRLITDDQSLLSRKITGILDARSAGSAVAALCTLSGTTYVHDGQNYILR